jgi:hypothetical protein
MPEMTQRGTSRLRRMISGEPIRPAHKPSTLSTLSAFLFENAETMGFGVLWAPDPSPSRTRTYCVLRKSIFSPSNRYSAEQCSPEQIIGSPPQS